MQNMPIKITKEWAKGILDSWNAISNDLKYALVSFEELGSLGPWFDADIIWQEYREALLQINAKSLEKDVSIFSDYIIDKINTYPGLSQRDFDFILDPDSDGDIRDLIFYSKEDAIKRFESSFSAEILEQLGIYDVVEQIPTKTDSIEISIHLSLQSTGDEDINWSPITSKDIVAELRIDIMYGHSEGTDCFIPEWSLEEVYKNLTFIKTDTKNRDKILLLDFNLIDRDFMDMILYDPSLMQRVQGFDRNLYLALENYNDWSEENILKLINNNPLWSNFLSNFGEERSIYKLKYYLDTRKDHEYTIWIRDAANDFHDHNMIFPWPNAFISISSLIDKINTVIVPPFTIRQSTIDRYNNDKGIEIYGYVFEEWKCTIIIEVKDSEDLVLTSVTRAIRAKELYEIMKILGNTDSLMDDCIQFFPPEEYVEYDDEEPIDW